MTRTPPSAKDGSSKPAAGAAADAVPLDATISAMAAVMPIRVALMEGPPRCGALRNRAAHERRPGRKLS